jgi:hypothetical protein
MGSREESRTRVEEAGGGKRQRRQKELKSKAEIFPKKHSRVDR